MEQEQSREQKPKKRNKLQIVLIIVGALIMISFAGAAYWFQTQPTQSPNTNAEEDRILEQITQNEENKEAGKPLITLEEDVEKLLPADMTENEMQTAIHHMTHQKIEAEKKWGALIITQERVDRLLEIAKAKEVEYKHGSVYVRILERWQKGDFSTVDKDHNTIWTYQGGTVGKATGVLSSEEEAEFVEEYLK